MKTLSLSCLVGLLFFLLSVPVGAVNNVGVEVVHDYAALNAAHIADPCPTLNWSFNIGNGYWEHLNHSGANSFYYARQDCWEADMRDVTQGGLDLPLYDNLDIGFIVTHGNNWGDSIRLAYNCRNDNWVSDSTRWKFNNTTNWIVMYACDTLPHGHEANTCHRFFYGLHQVLGAYAHLYDGWTTEECGRDFADDLNDGDTMTAAWLDACADWYCSQHPEAVAAERATSLVNGHVQWNTTVMNQDHYLGHGFTTARIPHDQIAFYTMRWLNP